jgi:hypothetical protein
MRDASSGDKLKIALFGDLSLEEAMDLSRDRQILELEVRKSITEMCDVCTNNFGLNDRIYKTVKR